VLYDEIIPNPVESAMSPLPATIANYFMVPPLHVSKISLDPTAI
jgi:hypothetical protein